MWNHWATEEEKGAGWSWDTINICLSDLSGPLFLCGCFSDLP